MNILYCGDRNIKKGLILSILSLIKNVDEDLCIYILTINAEVNNKNIEGIRYEDIDGVLDDLKQKNPNNFIKIFDITQEFNKEIPFENMETRFTPCCMLRLYADTINELPNKILYLDNDVICRKNPFEFYNQNLDDTELVGVLDYYGKWFFKNNLFKFDYLNSGVLLMNLDKIRKEQSFYKCRKLCQNTKMFMPSRLSMQV